ncbi:hypothetical protein WN48_05138 [Eufriesea mexicana]|nr:hypothetical protein WN48_05138 [Eufriesea mexicana]
MIGMKCHMCRHLNLLSYLNNSLYNLIVQMYQGTVQAFLKYIVYCVLMVNNEHTPINTQQLLDGY